jgi:hypothetical protein
MAKKPKVSREEQEDLIDLKEAQKALEESKRKGTRSWETIKKTLKLK